MPTRERMLLVQRWDELQIGMIVVLKDCRVCGGKHRSLLISPLKDMMGFNTDTGQLEAVPHAYEAVPKPHDNGFFGWGIHPRQVAQKRLYRIVDGLEIERVALREVLTSR